MSQQKSRREFLLLARNGVIIAGLGPLLAACGKAVNSGAVESGGDALAKANPTATAAASLPGVGAGKGAPRQTPNHPADVMITNNADFYTVSYREGNPAMPNDWKLQVVGNVDKPMTLTLDDIKKMPAITEMRTMECISNPAGGPLISNANWKAIKMADLMNTVGVKPNTLEIKVDSFDGFHTSIPLDLAMHEHALLAYEMNGEPLPIEHGKPLRCLWPGRYGMKQPKWIQKITALTEKHTGYWEGQGWSNQAYIKPNSRIDAPQDNEKINQPSFSMMGVSFSGEDGIAKIEISLDEGKTWQEAELVRGPTPYVWTNWHWNGASPADGQYSLLARVTDKAGRQQQREQLSILGGTFPDGTSAIAPVVANFKKG